MTEETAEIVVMHNAKVRAEKAAAVRGALIVVATSFSLEGRPELASKVTDVLATGDDGTLAKLYDIIAGLNK